MAYRNKKYSFLESARGSQGIFKRKRPFSLGGGKLSMIYKNMGGLLIDAARAGVVS